MGYRDFRDSEGRRWQAWDVVPQLGERRSGPRRASGKGGRASDRPGGIDRRSGMDRRILVTRRPTLGEGLGQGWLCFESGTEKRRLVPIPADWMRCRESKLEDYCRQASPVRRPSGEVGAPIFVEAPRERTLEHQP